VPTAVRLTARLGRNSCMAECCAEGSPVAMLSRHIAIARRFCVVTRPEATGAPPRGTFTEPRIARGQGETLLTIRAVGLPKWSVCPWPKPMWRGKRSTGAAARHLRGTPRKRTSSRVCLRTIFDPASCDLTFKLTGACRGRQRTAEGHASG
jgi:hypothetical protein